ncbi:MAG: InlB B-repeat-containing protein, partial [Acholeplasmatales bacterium]|nr:InlB B-repeat-containing protein [Acholeplasmatales bacterium]
MKKRHLLLGLLLVSGIISLSSCNFFKSEEYVVSFETNGGSDLEAITVVDGKYTVPSEPTRAGYTFAGWYADKAFSAPIDINELDEITADIKLYAKWTINTYTVTFNSNGGSAVSNATVEYNKPVSLPAAPTKEGYEFGGWFTDEALTTQYTGANIVANTTLYAKWTEEIVYIVTFNTMGGNEIAPQYVTKDEYGFYTVQRPADPTCNYKTFVNWYADEAGTTLFDFGNEISGNVTVYAKWDAGYEWVTTDAGFDAGAAAYPGKAKPTTEVTFGRFTYGAGVYFEEATSSKTACVNNQQKDITFQLTGRTNKIEFNIKYGSSGSNGTVTLYKIVDGAKVAIEAWNETGQNDYAVENLEAGTYVFGSVGSYRFYSLKISEELQQSAPNGIEIATLPQTNFLEGREFNSNNLAVYLTYENGRKDLVSDFEVDSSAYSTDPGNYTISVSYGLTDEYATYNFDTAYEVSVYDAVSISYGDHVLNSSRVTLPLEQVFLTGSEFTTKNLAIKAKGLKVGTDNEYVEFVLGADEYSLSAVDTSVKGAQTVTITAFETLTNSYVINVVDKVLNEESASANIVVDAAAEVAVSSEAIVFNRINDALRYLELCKVADDAVKTITVKAGSYYEKVEVKLPNVRLIGENDGTKETVVWYDRINGMNDPSGSTAYSTDGSASVSIRSSAVGFYAQDITFKNYYNTHELYLESLKISSDSQAVAVLVQADQSVFKNVKFTSYHDTLYAQIGRQYYVDCYIEGRTDYIFGYNATAYFENCDIMSIGAGVTEKNGGYVVATKGYSSGAGQDDVLYGYVFNNCNFYGDENVQDGSVSIARGWAEGMAIMVMNSSISKAFSKEVYGNNESPLNDRYGKMNAAPTPALLLEYNNTGEGALVVPADDAETADVNEALAFVEAYKAATCTIVTDANVAAPYEELIKVFAADNKNVHWTSDWAGPNEKDATVNFVFDNNVVATIKGYIGGKLTTDQINVIKDSIVLPEGYRLVKLAFDAEGNNVYEPTTLAETNTIYVIAESLAGVQTKELVYSASAESNDDYVINQASSGSSKVNALEEGAAVGSEGAISLKKLIVITDSIETVAFDPVKNAKVELLGGTSSTGNTQIFKVEALDAEGNVVATVYSAPCMSGKTLGYMLDADGNKYVEVAATTDFVKIRISATGDKATVGDGGCAGKNFCPAVVKVSYDLYVQTTTYNL